MKAENAQKARKLKLEEQTKLYDLVEQQSAPQFARLETLLSQLSYHQKFILLFLIGVKEH